MSHRRRALAVALVAGLAVAVPAVAASAPQVKVGDDYFSVKHLTVTPGTRVNWTWAGVLNHNVTVRSGPASFHSRTQARGSYSHVFTKPGTYTLYCTIHPQQMRMTVVVK